MPKFKEFSYIDLTPNQDPAIRIEFHEDFDSLHWRARVSLENVADLAGRPAMVGLTFSRSDVVNTLMPDFFFRPKIQSAIDVLFRLVWE